MTPALIMLTLTCVLGIACGQILFKQAAMSIEVATAWQHWVFNGWLLAALALYGATTLFWVWILRQAPLHLAYPFMGLAFIIVPCLEYFLFGTVISVRTLLGGMLIMVGVILCANA